ncbi:MAG: carbonic anhydrase [Nitrospirae bacterium]|nr:carbonic anhydrase [Nitrospirota bacterium]
MRYSKVVALAIFSAALCLPMVHSHASGPTTHVSAKDALKFLQQGNARFVKGKSRHPHSNAARIKETGKGQAPFATIVGCSDSRVPPERLFDQGIGDLFVVRVAGNVCDVDETGSAEYGVDHLGTPLLVVLGHSKCGAVTAVVNKAEVHGSIPQLVDNIGPAVARAKAAYPAAQGDDLLTHAIRENIWQSIEDLLHSPLVRKRVDSGKLMIHGAVYDVESGKVYWLGRHPRQDELLHAVSESAPQEHGSASEEEAEE